MSEELLGTIYVSNKKNQRVSYVKCHGKFACKVVVIKLKKAQFVKSSYFGTYCANQELNLMTSENVLERLGSN